MVTAAMRPPPPPTEADVRAVLASIPDPEIPVLSVVDLGMVHAIDIAPGRIRVEILPTFVGCPALEMIRGSIAERLAELAPDAEVAVEVSFAEPWTSDRISDGGRSRLRAAGFAPPARLGTHPAGHGGATLVALSARVACPYCGSFRTALENPFGPSPCRAIHHCSDCRQPFERFKPI